ncbi:MAG: hypothetical protein EBZ60_05645 [Betaproteobacteria bacterium]|nr:hypothetical protein [Betaproteobacteria bacterium]
MKKHAITGLAMLASLGAWADERPMQFLAGVDYTYGGDKLYKAIYKSGDTQDITAGGTYAFQVGANYPIGRYTDLQLTIGLHTVSTNANNGKIAFTRYPIELLGFYQFSDYFRLGGGFRQSLGASSTTSGAASNLSSYDFKSSMGGVVEMQYLFRPDRPTFDKNALTLRFATENFTTQSNSPVRVNGNHWGLGLAFYR